MSHGSWLQIGLAIFCGFAPFPARAAEIELDLIQLPPGFQIEIFARVPGARSLAVTPRGTVFVGTRGDKVYAISNGRVLTVAEGLTSPNGVAFRDGVLFVAEISRILAYDQIEGRLEKPPNPRVVRDGYPENRHHGWKFIRFSPDGWLYVPVGAPCNICNPEEPFATITRLRPEGKGFEIYSRGVRNTVGFDWDPANGELWFTDNGRDGMGDRTPPDELNGAPRPGMHFGYPYCHGRDIPDPTYGKGRACSEFTPPAMVLPAHVAALGLRFYTGRMFPEAYHRQVFVAEHGSWDRSEKIGYRVSLITFRDRRPADYRTFASGWLQGQRAWGRPVDVEVYPDGSLLVSDDGAGAVYRITHAPEED